MNNMMDKHSALKPESDAINEVQFDWIEKLGNYPARAALIALALAVLVLLLAFITRNSILESYQDADRAALDHNTRMMRLMIEQEMQNVGQLTNDGAVWDDTYQFIQDGNQEYIDANLKYELETEDVDIDLIALYDLQGKLVYGDATGPSLDLDSPWFKETVLTSAYLNNTGLLATGADPLMISMYPILPSSGEGYSRGTLVMGRYMDTAWQDNLLNERDINLELVDEPTLAARLGDTGAAEVKSADYFLEELDPGASLVYFGMPDLRGRQITMVFPWSRQILSTSTRMVDFAIAAISAALVTVILMFIAGFTVYSRKIGRSRKLLADALRERTRELSDSEKRHRAIFDNSPIGIAYVNSQGIVIDVNPSMIAILGQSADYLIGSSLNERFRGQELSEMFNTAVLGITIRTDTEYFRKKDQKNIFVNTVFRPIESDQFPSDVLVMAEDVTERKRDEVDLRQLYTAVESSPVAVVVNGIDGYIKYANRFYSLVSGYSLEETVGQRHDILNLRTETRGAYQEMMDTILSGETWRGEFRNLKKSGERYWERAVVAPVTDPGGKVSHYVAINEDYTERKLSKEVEELLAWFERQKMEDIQDAMWREIFIKLVDLTQSKDGLVILEYRMTNTAFGVHSGDEGYEGYPLDEAAVKNLFSSTACWKGLLGERNVLISNGPGLDVNSLLTNGVPHCERMMFVPLYAEEGTIAVIVLANKPTDYNEVDEKIAWSLINGIWQLYLRKQAQKEVQDSQERLEAILRAVNTGIVMINSYNRKIVYANDTALDMFGGQEQDMVGKECHLLMCPNERNYCPILDKQQKVDKREAVLLKADGSRLPILKTVVPVSMGSRQFLLESFMDISERKVIEKELEQAKDRAEVANRTKSQFLANMSHEIRTPMNAVLGYSQLMMREPNLTPPQRAHLNIINRSGNHLMQLINEILEMSKIESGRIELNRVLCDFSRLLKDIEDMFRLNAQEKGIALLFEARGFIPQALIMDEGKIRQILVNLLGNAMKFTGPNGQIELLYNIGEPAADPAEPVTIHIEVADTGPGIPASEQEHIFESFSQGESGELSGGGTGLGLAISREYARIMGGDLVLISSEPGKGSRFGIEFSALMSFEEIPFEGGNDLMRIVGIAGEKQERRVLIVDDHPANRGFISELLTSIGFSVQEAEDGYGAIYEFEKWNPHIILMDLMMPGMDGLEAMRLIRSRVEGLVVPILAISASVLRDDEIQALTAGASAFLRKPFREPDLLESIRRLMGLEYDYEDIKAALPNDEVLDEAYIVSSLKSVPAGVLQEMLHAVDMGDTQQLNLLIRQMPDGREQVTELLQDWVQNYDYDRFTQVINEALLLWPGYRQLS